jgi:hypothetical protein
MNNINVNEVLDCKNQLENIINNLEEKCQLILQEVDKVSNILTTLKSWNGLDASEMYKEILKNESEEFIYYKYIWNIMIKNDSEFSSERNMNMVGELKSQIENLSYITNNIENSAELVENFIHQIELQLNVSYSGNIIEFFESLKDNEAWQEIKETSQQAINKKNDEIYLKYRSKTGESDFVDYALDEIGNKFLISTYSTKYALWYQENYPNSGADASDNWCAEFVTYVFNKSGNKDNITPYLECVSGATSAKSRSENGNGTWHDASDTSYQPQRGDIFYQSGHTGIVIASDENYIYTIEGNTVQDDGLYYVKDGLENSGGGFVNTRVRTKDYVDIGYYTPNVYINSSGAEQSLDTNFSTKYMTMKNAIQEKYEALKIEGNH